MFDKTNVPVIKRKISNPPLSQWRIIERDA